MTRRHFTVNMHDMHVGLWQEDPADPTLRSEIYGGLIASAGRTICASLSRSPGVS